MSSDAYADALIALSQKLADPRAGDRMLCSTPLPSDDIDDVRRFGEDCAAVAQAQGYMLCFIEVTGAMRRRLLDRAEQRAAAAAAPYAPKPMTPAQRLSIYHADKRKGVSVIVENYNVSDDMEALLRFIRIAVHEKNVKIEGRIAMAIVGLLLVFLVYSFVSCAMNPGKCKRKKVSSATYHEKAHRHFYKSDGTALGIQGP